MASNISEYGRYVVFWKTLITLQDDNSHFRNGLTLNVPIPDKNKIKNKKFKLIFISIPLSEI